MKNVIHLKDTTGCYFITFTITDWVDVFIKPVYKQIIIHTLNHFTEHKELSVFGWCLMSNHLHLVIKPSKKSSISEFEKEFKSFTEKKILEFIYTEPEVRRRWMLERFEKSKHPLSLLKKYQLWQNSSNPIFIDIRKPKALAEHIEYVHKNPVRDRIVSAPEDYLYCSARDYAGMTGLVTVSVLPSVEQYLFISETVHDNFFGKYISN
ncbi:MAG: transposase [Sphingobacteriales bacterium]|nr:transposase [Sphingobacteriales bacterium]